MRHLTVRYTNSANHPYPIKVFKVANRGIAKLACENIAKPLTQSPHSFIGSVARNWRSTPHSQRAQVIYSMRVIGVVMCPNNAVYLRDLGREQLLAQVGWRIDQQPRAVIPLNHDRDAGTPIARLIRITIAPVVANPWNAG